MKIDYDGQLLTIELSISYQGRTLQIMEVDVGILPKSHKGLLGLDILKTNGFIVDMEKLELHSPHFTD